jgi:hypothetical protein
MEMDAGGRVVTGTGGLLCIGMTGRVWIGIGGGIHWNMHYLHIHKFQPLHAGITSVDQLTRCWFIQVVQS